MASSCHSAPICTVGTLSPTAQGGCSMHPAEQHHQEKCKGAGVIVATGVQVAQ